MVNVFEVADLLVLHAIVNYPDEVDLIAYYGSQARGDSRPDSDLDLFYTPAGGKNPPIRRTFLLDGVLFDFWPLSWETLEGFATGTIRGWAFAPALVRQATPLYVRSTEQGERLAELQRCSRALEQPDQRLAMQERAQDAFSRVVEQLGSLRLVARHRQADVSYAAWQLIRSVWECLALANQVTFRRGFSKALAEPEKLPHRPVNLSGLVNTISTSSSVEQVLRAADELVAATHFIVQELEPTQPAKRSIREAFDQVYPEMKDILRKLLAACEAGDHVAASLEAYSLQSDVASILSETREGCARRSFALYTEHAAAYDEAGFPDLMALASGSLGDLADATRRFDAQLRRFLREHSVDLCEFSSVEDLRNAL